MHKKITINVDNKKLKEVKALLETQSDDEAIEKSLEAFTLLESINRMCQTYPKDLAYSLESMLKDFYE